MKGLALVHDPNLLVGLEKADDAGVYKLNDEVAIIQTLDFVTPIVDDPFSFGRIAAANSLSDVYAMGGRPICAMNIVCFPARKRGVAELREILRGGLETLHEAGVVLVGGHSVDDPQPKYGLSVTGLVHPARVLRKQGSQAGDRLILTKPIGTGIISTALKANLASPEAVSEIVRSMTMLNAKAASLMRDFPVHACTDVTGFGLLGHASEMIEGTGLSMTIHAESVPLFREVPRYLELGLAPGGLYRNLEFRKGMLAVEPGLPEALINILFDPQTSGGLLIALPGREAQLLLARLHQEGIPEAVLIGSVSKEKEEKIILKK